MATNSTGIVHSKRSCCVVGCSNSEGRTPNLSFYRFPGRKWEIDRKQKWIEAIQQINKKNKFWNPTTNSRVCSAHFVGGKKSDSINSDSYIPSIFPNVLTRHNPCVEVDEPLFERREILEVILVEDHEGDVKMENELETASTECQTDACIEVGVDEPSILFCWNGGNDASTQTKIFTRSYGGTRK